MCGIVGVFTSGGNKLSLPDFSAALASIRHRGPDAHAVWQDDRASVKLGHVRLSILDLSEAGAQPMASVSGRYMIVFNGEIYNHLEIREELQRSFVNISWRGHSDTETLLAAIDQWGLEHALDRCAGMFAFGLWDRQERLLSLARDRLGEKPLYYFWHKGAIGFSSELKALRELDILEPTINLNSVNLFLRNGYIPAPYTIYNDAYKLLPGHILNISEKDIIEKRLPNSFAYWDINSIVKCGNGSPFAGSNVDAVLEVTSCLKRSVKEQMLADVPIGAFLSGGVDSSLIVALMQQQSMYPIKTFGLGFTDASYDESRYAKEIAEYLGTDHTQWTLTPEEALDTIPRMPVIYDEPFADVSAIPTVILSSITRQKVSVSLSGDAGDELFAGYNRYIYADKVWGCVSKLPLSARGVCSSILQSLDPAQWDSIANPIIKGLPKSFSYGGVGNKLHRLAGAIVAKDLFEFYSLITSKWSKPEEVMIVGNYHKIATSSFLNQNGDLSMEGMMLADMLQYLPDDILVKVDRAAMSVSLETRVPMLDHRFVEFAWTLPMKMKVHNGRSKWILKEVLKQFVPNEMIDRPKMGFDVPIDRWLRGPLRDWADALLSPVKLNEHGIFDANIVQSIWMAHLSGRHSYYSQLWPILMFQAWYEEWM